MPDWVFQGKKYCSKSTGTPMQKLQAINRLTKVWTTLAFYHWRVGVFFALVCFGWETLTAAIIFWLSFYSSLQNVSVFSREIYCSSINPLQSLRRKIWCDLEGSIRICLKGQKWSNPVKAEVIFRPLYETKYKYNKLKGESLGVLRHMLG